MTKINQLFEQGNMHKTICVDFDGTLVDSDPDDNYKIIDWKPGAIEFLNIANDEGYEIVILSSRTNYGEEQVQIMTDFIKAAGIDFVKIATKDMGKPAALYYIDDKSVKFTNWNDMIKLIKGENQMSETRIGKLLNESVTISDYLKTGGPGGSYSGSNRIMINKLKKELENVTISTKISVSAKDGAFYVKLPPNASDSDQVDVENAINDAGFSVLDNEDTSYGYLIYFG
jgi:hypothetical protein